MKKVLFILRNHFTNDARVLKEARSLTNAGYHITIFCLWDNGLKRNETLDGIEIKRIARLPQNSPSVVQKITSLISFSLQCLLRGSFRYDIIHCHDLDTLPIATFIKCFKPKTRLIYDAHEYETERAHIKGIVKRLYQVTERFFIRYANAVIAVSNSIADEYERLYHIPKPYLILNCPPYQKIEKHDLFRKRFSIRSDQMIFLYQGGLMEHRGIEMTLEAFKNVTDGNKVIVFMGYGSLENMIKQAASEYNTIFYHEAVNQNVLLQHTASADVGLMLIENTSLSYYYCAPNKFYEYSMAGLPVIISNLYDMRRLVEKYDNGLIVEQNNMSRLLDVITHLTHDEIKHMQRNIPEITKKYNWEQQEKILLDIYGQ